MTTRPQRPCHHPGCGALQPCPTHGQRPVDLRASSPRRGYGRMHQRWRAMVLARHPLCVICLTRGFTRGATVADHIRPIPQPNWWAGDWSLDNGQGLCHFCHNAKSAKERYA